MKKFLSIILALVIGVSASLNAFAASAKKNYVSNIVAVTASSENDAKAQFTKAGYQYLENSNLNSSLKTGVYLGYKETENPDEALTDISAMNMTGKYSYSDYKQIMEQFREKIYETVDDFLPVIAEYQVNYEAEKPQALAAYKSLNIFKEDESGKLMGDYLLQYDFNDQDEQKLTDRFMKANTQYILTIMNQTSLAGDDSDDTMIDRLVKTGPDGIKAKYTKVYPTIAKATQAMTAEYGASAQIAYDDWNSLYEYICDVEKELAKSDAPIETESESEFSIDYVESAEINVADFSEKDYSGLSGEAKKYVDALNTSTEYMKFSSDIIDFSLYNMLKETEYGSGTLLDFFKRPASEVKKEELYPLIDSMSEGQRSQLEMNGLSFTLIGAFSDLESGDEEAEKAVEIVETVSDSFDTISIYEGMDKSLFEDGIAFTSAATEHEMLTGESWMARLTGADSEKEAWLKAVTVSSVITGVLAAVCIGSTIVSKIGSNIEAVYQKAHADLAVLQDFAGGKTATYKNFTQATAFTKVNDIDVINPDFAKVQDELYAKENEAYNTYEKWKNADVCKKANIVKCVSFVMLVVALAFDIYTICEYFNAEELTEETIPHHLMSAAQTPYGEDYVYYETVKNLKGEAADTNNHEANKKIGWLVLYTTKDKSAGGPILVKNLKVVNDTKSINPEASFISLFGEAGALNFTKDTYTGVKDGTGGTYILFERDESIFAQGSAITNGTAAIIGVGGLALGAVLGAVITKLAGKKKKKEEAPAEA